MALVEKYSNSSVLFRQLNQAKVICGIVGLLVGFLYLIVMDFELVLSYVWGLQGRTERDLGAGKD